MSATDGSALHLPPGPLPGTGLPPSAAIRSKWRRALVAMVQAGGDAASFMLSFAILWGAGWTGLESQAGSGLLALCAGLCLGQFALLSLYPGYALHPPERLRRRTLATWTTIAVALALAAARLVSVRDMTISVTFLVLSMPLQLGARLLLQGLLQRFGLWGERVIIVADPRLGAQVEQALACQWTLGLLPASLAAPGTQHPTVAVVADAHPSPERIAELLREHEKVILLADLPNLQITGLRPASIGGRAGLTLRGAGRRPPFHALQRVLDLAIAVPLVITFSPLVAVAGVAVWIADPGPVFYRQEREGKDGRIIRILKLRTMYTDAEARLSRLLDQSPSLRAEWETYYKLRADPRIIPVIGPLLRTTSCDELPQLLNVISGDMSLVGPRPFPIYHLGAMDAKFRAKRRTVQPGLTGLWQVSNRSTADLHLQQQLDEFYIDNRSIWLDCHILLCTVQAVLGRKGAH